MFPIQKVRTLGLRALLVLKVLGFAWARAMEIQKLFNYTIQSRIPNDYFSLHRAVTLGQPVDGHCELGKAIEGLAGRLSGVTVQDKKRAGLSEVSTVQ